MNQTEYRVLEKRSGSIICLIALAFILGMATFLAMNEVHHKRVRFSPDWAKSWQLWVFIAGAGFVIGFLLWKAVRNLIAPYQILLVNSSGITLGRSGRFQRFYPWNQVRGFSVGEIFQAWAPSSNAIGGKRMWPALKIEFEDAADLEGVFSVGFWGQVSVGERKAFLIDAKFLTEKLDDVVKLLSQIKQNARS
jgi:hypothetical protein